MWQLIFLHPISSQTTRDEWRRARCLNEQGGFRESNERVVCGIHALSDSAILAILAGSHGFLSFVSRYGHVFIVSLDALLFVRAKTL